MHDFTNALEVTVILIRVIDIVVVVVIADAIVLNTNVKYPKH